jgi:hypothetical protein
MEALAVTASDPAAARWGKPVAGSAAGWGARREDL